METPTPKLEARQDAVLVVEDEPLVNWDISEALRADGFDIVQAFSGEQAITMLEDRSDIRLVFTDVNLPGRIDGIALAHAVEKRWPQIELLMTSAQEQPRIDQLDCVANLGRFVPKPYPNEAVARRIHDIIDAQAA